MARQVWCLKRGTAPVPVVAVGDVGGVQVDKGDRDRYTKWQFVY